VKFFANARPLVLVTILLIAGTAAVSIVRTIIQSSAGGLSTGRSATVYVLMSGIAIVVNDLLAIGLWQSALAITDGERPRLSTAYSTPYLISYIGASLLRGLMIVVGLVFLIVPGILLLFFTYLVPLFVLTKGEGPVQAIKSSFSITSANFGVLLVLALAVVGIDLAGALACLVGLVAAVPIGTITVVYAFRTVNGELVAP
jgi:uncharacterized membrane protein